MPIMFPIYPFRIFAALSDSTLANRIRQESWNIDRIFPGFKKAESSFQGLAGSIKSNLADLGRVNVLINQMKSQIRAALTDLKRINFYDSAILYLSFKSLRNLLDLCKKEETRLIEKTKEAGELKEAREKIEDKIKEYGRLINGFDAAKKALIKDYEHLVIELRKRRWDLEKLAQHEFAFIRFTLRSMENLNRKIKVEAIKLKEEVVPKETPISKKIKQGILDPKDFKLLAKLILKGIDRISKDVRYSSKLISKFENKIKKLRKIMESLKNSVNNLAKKNKVSEETQKKLKEAFDSWDSAIKSLDEEVNKDLMQIFRNIFVEYKYIGTRQLKAA